PSRPSATSLISRSYRAGQRTAPGAPCAISLHYLKGANSGQGVGLITANTLLTSVTAQRLADARARQRSTAPSGRIRHYRRLNERLERLLIDLLTFVKIDRTPSVPFEARVEKVRRIGERRSFRERELHDLLVALPGA